MYVLKVPIGPTTNKKRTSLFSHDDKEQHDVTFSRRKITERRCVHLTAKNRTTLFPFGGKNNSSVFRLDVSLSATLRHPIAPCPVGTQPAVAPVVVPLHRCCRALLADVSPGKLFISPLFPCLYCVIDPNNCACGGKYGVFIRLDNIKCTLIVLSTYNTGNKI